MQFEERILTFVQLKTFLQSENGKLKIEDWKYRIANENKWFTPENIDKAINAIISNFLDEAKLRFWLADFTKEVIPKKVGLVLSGNLPAVGFFDMLAVVLSGNLALLKLSTSDTVLMKGLIQTLFEINPNIEKYIQIVEKLNESDAFIATGSDNSARYFEYYFSKKPNIIRKNRSSLAILNGSETEADFKALATDIFNYYGLGCRNVSKIFVPQNYDFVPFYDAIESWNTILNNNKYQNNYDYNKSVLLINGTPHYDNGFLLLTENPSLVSPISVLYYEYYNDFESVSSKIEEVKDKIQCIVGDNLPFDSISFGQSQEPSLTDYPDGVDVLAFLKSIEN